MEQIDGSRAPDPIDAAVGAKIRAARRQRRMSQASLGEALGLSFQQVQKYESGINRISASMLVKAARTMGLKPKDFLPDSEQQIGPSQLVLSLLSQLQEAEQLVEAYARIRSPKLRRAVLVIATSFASNPEAAEEG